MDSGSLGICNEACSLVNGMKSLQVSSSSSPISPLSPTPSVPSSMLSTASSSSSEDLLDAAASAYYLDSFLQEALNSRNRITVLRLEQEIEKFVSKSKQQQLLLRPMPSSYERLAAHRVAQYYNLQSMAVESNGSSSGSRVLVLKSSLSKLPSIRLAEIPVAPMQNKQPVSAPLGKVAIKQRASGAISGSDVTSAGRMTPLKSVEERTEEYNRARARIFSSRDSASERDRQVGAVSGGDQQTRIELPLNREIVSTGAERDQYEDEAAIRAASRVAVFRDREKDVKDPDYDRSYGRYSPPLKTEIQTSGRPFVAQGMCFASSSSDMTCQSGIGTVQKMGVDAGLYPVSENQSGPWVGLAGLPVLGYPCASPGISTQGQSLYNAHPPAQKLVHPGYHSFANWCQVPVKINSQPMPSGYVMDWFRSY